LNLFQDIYIGAGENSATTLEWAMTELIRNPRVMEKAQAEVRQVLIGRRKLEETEQQLDYLKSVIKETLRLHPLVPLLIRESKEGCKISKYDIPTKTKGIINVGPIRRDPKCWIDADCFQPERFQGSSVDFKGTDFEFIPFRVGKRMCPGLPFGAATVEFALA
jgi:cytochrome P450